MGFSDILSQIKSNITPAVTTTNTAYSNLVDTVSNLGGGVVSDVANTVLSDAIQMAKSGLADKALETIQKLLPVTSNLAVNDAIRSVTEAITKGTLSSLGLFSTNTSPNVLQGLNSRQDALLNYNWFVEFPTINGINLPWYYCEGANLPWRNIDKKPVQRRSLTWNIAGKSTVGDLKLDLFLDESGIVWQYFREWEGLILSPSRGINIAQGMGGRYGQYAKPITIHILSTTRSQILSVIYFGCWPNVFDDLTLTNNESDRLKTTATFSVTDMDYQVATLVSSSPLDGIFNSGSTISGITGTISGLFS